MVEWESRIRERLAALNLHREAEIVEELAQRDFLSGLNSITIPLSGASPTFLAV